MFNFLLLSLAFLLKSLQIAGLNQKYNPPLTNTIAMKTYFGVFFLLFSSLLFSQNNISGVINQYAKVLDIDPCEGKLTVSDAASFVVGDQILLMQMKGATINTSNSSSYGNVDEPGSVGFFEKNEIAAIAANTIFLKFELSYNYNVGGSVQLVSFPTFQNAQVTDLMTAAPWDGSIGGVLAFSVEKTLTLQAPIDASGKGFLGGQVNVVSSDCTWLTNASDYSYSLTNWRGAPKGEGIAALISGKEQGRGAQANGGGGGNDHNSGGGGGGNMTAGGGGGKQGSSSTFGCDGDNPGKGGKAAPADSERIFLGGGGGAGHVDNANAGSAGGNGGGIILVFADTLKANGFAISANGATASLAPGDGAGGGGAGGTILLKVNKTVGTLLVEALGGNGGNVNNEPNRCYGAGGGGSGGRVLTNLNNLTISISGGIAGVNTVVSNQCNDPSNGAEPGNSGVENPLIPIPHSSVEIETIAVVSQPQFATGCEGQQVSFEFLMQGNYLEYQWQINTGNGWANVQNGPNFSGILSSLLTIFNLTPSLNGYQFRCLVSTDCGQDIISSAVALSVVAPPQADFSWTSLGNGGIQFMNTSANSNSWHWDFGDNTTSDEQNPSHVYTDFGTYTVTLTAISDCGSMVYELEVIVTTAPEAAFSVSESVGCSPFEVQFFNQSSDNSENYEWHFPGGVPETSLGENPVVTYPNVGQFPVILIVSNIEGNDTLALTNLITVKSTPNVNFNMLVNGQTIQFVNLSSGGTGGYTWDFGDMETSNEFSPEHTFPAEGFYEVTLTAVNDCGESSFTQTVSTGLFPHAAFSANTISGCAPLTVAFQNQSTGSNLSGFIWEFTGGEPAFSTAENPVVTYSEPGSYAVKLTSVNAIGDHTASIQNYIIVKETPVADFTFSVNGDTVVFNNLSANADYFNWDFDDASQATSENPTHIYAQNGIYNVTLTASNSACGNTVSFSVLIMTTGINEPSDFNAKLYPNPVYDLLYLDFTEPISTGIHAAIRDLNGKLWRQFLLNNKLEKMDVQELPDGVYFIELKTGKKVEWRKFIKASGH